MLFPKVDKISDHISTV